MVQLKAADLVLESAMSHVSRSMLRARRFIEFANKREQFGKAKVWQGILSARYRRQAKRLMHSIADVTQQQSEPLSSKGEGDFAPRQNSPPLGELGGR
jgi:hypothetical protein